MQVISLHALVPATLIARLANIYWGTTVLLKEQLARIEATGYSKEEAEAIMDRLLFSAVW
jgi:hypothetical protein